VVSVASRGITRVNRMDPCYVCGGDPHLPRGKGIRCTGFRTPDTYHHCSREEHAGGLRPTQAAEPTYAHIDNPKCRCGLPHARYGETKSVRAPRNAVAASGKTLSSAHIPRNSTVSERSNGRVRAERRVVRWTPWKIRAADGTLQATHWRVDFADCTKEYPWQRADGSWGMPDGVSPTDLLYGAELLALHPIWAVLIVEGEKSADALRRLIGLTGIAVVATVCGASARLSPAVLALLLGRRVYLWPDFHEAGRRHMDQVASALNGMPAEVRLIRWGQRDKDDAADFVGRGHTWAELRELISTAVRVPC
jgi:hypothetical protein